MCLHFYTGRTLLSRDVERSFSRVLLFRNPHGVRIYRSRSRKPRENMNTLEIRENRSLILRVLLKARVCMQLRFRQLTEAIPDSRQETGMCETGNANY